MQPVVFALNLTALANVLLGSLVIVRAYRQRYAWYFMGIIVSVVLWSIGDMLVLAARDPWLAHVGEVLFYIAPMFTPACLWLFSAVFPDGNRLPRFGTLVAFLFLVSATATATVGVDTIASVQLSHPLNLVIPRLPGFVLYGLYLIAFFAASFHLQMKKMARASGLGRSQIGYTFYGIITSATLAIVSNVMLPLVGIRYLIWLGPLFSMIGIAAIALAIVRYRLFDIRVAIIRSLTYLLSLGILSVLYVSVVTILGQLLIHGQRAGTASEVINITVALLIVPTYPPLARVFRKVSNNLFYRDAYEPQALISALNQTLVQNVELDKLLKAVSVVIAKDLKAAYCLIGVRETQFRSLRITGTEQKSFAAEDIEEVRRITPKLATNVIITEYLPPEQAKLRRLLEKNDIAVLVRIAPPATTAREGLVGYIVLGQKKSGNLYGSQDVKILDIIAKELLIAVQNALHFEEIENFNTTLREKVETATRKLRATNERLVELDEIKDDFISMASHQLRTPLTSVKGYLSMVLEGDAGKLTREEKKMLSQAFASSQRMVFLITDLLNVSRLKTGKFVIDAVPTDLSQVIQTELAQLQEVADSKQLHLSYHKPDNFPLLMLDETKTRQVIMNFIDNAIYYTPDGGHISIELEDKPSTVELRVVDDGIGVPKGEQHHLFTKFYRAANARRARPDGTGLGLFMAKKVVLAQGGSIIFESVENKGSTFGFVFSKNRLRAPDRPALKPVALTAKR